MYDQPQKINKINNMRILSISYKLYKPASSIKQFSSKLAKNDPFLDTSASNYLKLDTTSN